MSEPASHSIKIDGEQPEVSPPRAELLRVRVTTGIWNRLALGPTFLYREAAYAIAALVILTVPMAALRGRTIDLATALLAFSTLAGVMVFAWRAYALYLAFHRYRNPAGTSSRDREADFVQRLIGPIAHDPSLLMLFGSAALANLGVFAYVSAQHSALPPFLPLHYSASGEVDRLGTPAEVFIMPTIGLVVLATNVLLARVLYRREPLASRLLVGASIFVQILLIVATANIVSNA